MKKIYTLIFALTLLWPFCYAQLKAQCTTPATVPYYNSFTTFTINNQLPACWAASNPSVTCLTFTGNVPVHNYLAFYNSPVGVSYFYSDAIHLIPGITYSISCWYNTGTGGGNSWTDFSLLLGASQSNTGLVSLASTNGPAYSSAYTSVSGTFTVAAPGTYYIAVRGTSAAGSAQYLNFDDLSVSAPCSLNSPSMSITSPSLICSGQTMTLTASGADTYTWAIGSHAPTYITIPVVASTSYVYYQASGTNTLSGCSGSVTKTITVNQSPLISITSSSQNNGVCIGQSISLITTAQSNYTYLWSPSGSTSQNVTISPTVGTTYSVQATNSNNCTSTQTIQIDVYPNPTIVPSSSQATICAGETATLSATGADTYTWVALVSGVLVTGTSAVVSPTLTTTYVVTGFSVNGCSSNVTTTQQVDRCVGIKTITKNTFVNVYPNPTDGVFTIETNSAAYKTIDVYDITGKVVNSGIVSGLEAVQVNLEHFSKGFYYVKIQSVNGTQVVKVLKE